MPINKDQSDLPRKSATTTSPDAKPRFVTALANAWYQQYLDAGYDTRAMSGDTRFRGSDAGTCSFSLALSLLERAGMGERSNPPTLADTWRLGLGQMVHGLMEDVLPLAFPGAECEVVGMTLHGEASFHADVLIKIPAHDEERESSDGVAIAVIPERTVLFELKTINGFGFKSATLGSKYRDPEGPRTNAIAQAALAAEAFDCDEVVIGYLSLELISVNEAQRQGVDDIGRFAAEWTYTRDEYLPIARAERARFQWIAATVDAGRMPERTIPALPKGAVITQPKTGAWSVTDPDNPLVVLDVGTTWHCDYCWHRDACISLP